MCAGDSGCLEGDTILPAQARIVTASFAIPQAGYDAELRLENQPFDNNNLTAEFDASGRLTTFSYVEESQLEQASAAFAEATGSAAAIKQAIDDRELNDLKAKAAILEQQVNIHKYEVDLAPRRRRRRRRERTRDDDQPRGVSPHALRSATRPRHRARGCQL